MATLVQEIEERLTGLTTTAACQSVGGIRELGDGVARVEGLRVVLGDHTRSGKATTCAAPAGSCRCPSAKACWAVR